MLKDKTYWENRLTECITNLLELSDLDFKSFVSHQKDRLKEHINAMGNTPGGGLFVFGVSNFKKVECQESDQFITDHFSNLARDTQEPPLFIQALRLNSSLGYLYAIHVHEGTAKPVFIKNRLPWGNEACFKRTGSQTVSMTSEEIRAALSKDQGHSFDETHLDEVTLDQLDEKKLSESVKGFDASHPHSENSIALLVDLKIATRVSNKVVPTLAGLLVYAKNLEEFRRFSNASIIVQWFGGLNRERAIKNKTIRGSLPVQLEAAYTLLKAEMWFVPKVTGARREDVPAFDERAIREIVANSVIHRDYTRMHQPIKIDIFTNRIEIENPGGLLPGLTPSNIIHRRSWRNPVLANLLSRLGFGEMDGQGIDVVLGIARQLKAPAPFLQDLGQSFKVTLFAPKPFDQFSAEEKRLTVTVLILLDSTVDNESLRHIFEISPERATTLIKSMVDEGILEPTTVSRKFAKYSLTKRFKEQSGL